MAPATSPVVVVLVLAAVGVGLYAFRCSIRQGQRFRRLVAWIEALRRGSLGEDPVFMACHREGRCHLSRPQRQRDFGQAGRPDGRQPAL